MNGQMHLALWGFAAVVLLVGLAGLLLLVSGLKRLVHGKLVGGGGRVLLALVFLFAFASVAAVALDLRTYLRLTYEQPVATLSFTALGPQDFRATLSDAAGHISSTELRGDDWQLDARVLKWKGPATVLGLDPLYRLGRLEGRYRNPGDVRHFIHGDHGQVQGDHPAGGTELLDRLHFHLRCQASAGGGVLQGLRRG